MENHERVRLLLVDGDDTIKGRGGRISHGAATIVSRWPGYIASAIWFLVCAISVITLLMFMTFMLLVREERMLFPRGGIKAACKSNGNKTFKLNNQFCKEMTNTSLLSGEIKRETPNIELLNAPNNIFYVRSKPLSNLSACAVESLLTYGPDKTIYLLMFDDYELNYEKVLKDKYKNLKFNKVKGNEYLKRTPFEGKNNDTNKTMIAAGLLTVWQFGGTVLSDNLVALKRIKEINKYEKAGEGTCLIDYELLSCPGQCASYVYEFIQELVCYNMSNGAAPIIDKSLDNFCGINNKDCEGARRATNVCDEPTHDKHCDFARLDMWLEVDPNMEHIGKHCPVTDRHSRSLMDSMVTNTTEFESNTTVTSAMFKQKTIVHHKKGNTKLTSTTVTAIVSSTTNKQHKKM